MPAIITDPEIALAQLKLLCAPDTDPTLQIELELQPILDNPQVKRASIWTAAHAYSLGDVVMPTESKRNGHRYKLVRTDGSGVLTSGATEPNWTTGRNNQVIDNTLTWQEDGREFASLWNIPYAAYLAWDLKVSKLTDTFNVKGDTQEMSLEQMFENCVKQRDRFRPWVVA